MPKRYFNESSAPQAGVVSDSLRQAVGIKYNEVPVWIHRMRVLGYPPGWLRKADMTNTTIKLFDGTETTLTKPEEPGATTYNPDSFISFPGFNVPLPKNAIDDYEHLGMPPMLPFQQLKYAKKTILAVKPVPYKRIKLSDDHEANKKAQSTGQSSSKGAKKSEQRKPDVEDVKPSTSEFIAPVMIKQEPVSAKKMKLTKSDQREQQEIIADSEFNPDKEIKIELDDPEMTFTNVAAISTPVRFGCDKNLSTVSLSPMPYENTTVSEDKASSLPLIGTTKEDEGIASTPASPEDKNEALAPEEVLKIADMSSIGNFSDFIAVDQSGTNTESNTSQASKLTLISMGAPVPSSLNGIKPPLENFAVGMGELIYFENLPNSTGVFDRLRKVIKKIRRKLG